MIVIITNLINNPNIDMEKKCPGCGNGEDDLYVADEDLGIDEPHCGRCNIRYSDWK